MNIRIELLNLQLKAHKLTAAEFAAKFSLIAEEYNRLQNLQQADCSTLRESLLLMHSREWDAWSRATEPADIERMDKNLKTIAATLKAMGELPPVA